MSSSIAIREHTISTDLDRAFAQFLRLDVANGDASADTVLGYRSELTAWVSWCAEHAVDARVATVDDVKRYREDLVGHGVSRRPSPISSTCCGESTPRRWPPACAPTTR